MALVLFFSRVCSMLMVKSGRVHLKKMFLGQDDDFVYIKFPSLAPFGIEDVDQFVENFKGNWLYGFDHAQYLNKTVFKVSKDIIFDHVPLSEFKNAPPWFRLLTASYLEAIQHIHDHGERFSGLPTSILVSYYPREGNPFPLEIDVLSGKPILLRLNVKVAFENKSFPESPALLIDKPIVNHGLDHGRAMHISEKGVHIFDSFKSHEGVVVSKMFDRRLKLQEIEEAIKRTASLVGKFEEFIKIREEERK
jgi:hypothetical protein